MLMNIQRQVQAGSRLTHQLLGYARKGKYETKLLQLNSLIEETSGVYGRTRKQIAIQRELAGDLLAIEADQGQIEQVLMNLFVNASDAMPDGGDIFLKTENVTHKDLQGKVYSPRPGKYVLLIVKDTGIGMDRKTQARIFEPFFTTKELGMRTGLGLASVYGIIKGHGGYIEVESEMGKGATFRVYLPAVDKKVLQKVEDSDTIQKGNETILIIEDEEKVMEVGQRLLKVLGYQVMTARDGKEAVETYQELWETIDLVILDMIMPNMGGGEVFDRLKEINPGVKVLLASGYSIDGEATRILERGCSGFIQKPFDLKQLSQSIRTILDKKKSGKNLEEGRSPE